MDWLFMELFEMDEHRKKMCELFFLIMKVGKGKNHTKTNLLYIVCFLPKGTSLDEGPFTVECWLVEGVMDALDGGGAWVKLSLEAQTKAAPSSDITL